MIRPHIKLQGRGPTPEIPTACIRKKGGNLTKIYRLLVLPLVVLGAWAQSDRGTITGTVADPTGALIPAARVVLTNVETGSRSETVTTTTGNYTLAALPVGTYRLSVEHAGFSKSEMTNIEVQVAVTTRLEVVLQVGSATQSVEVTGESTLLRAESGEQSTTIQALFPRPDRHRRLRFCENSGQLFGQRKYLQSKHI